MQAFTSVAPLRTPYHFDTRYVGPVPFRRLTTRELGNIHRHRLVFPHNRPRRLLFGHFMLDDEKMPSPRALKQKWASRNYEFLMTRWRHEVSTAAIPTKTCRAITFI